MALTNHLHQWEDDLKLVKDTGLKTLRYPVPWHRIEPQRGVFEWGWMDEVMGFMQENGLNPIVDLVHHTSFPLWLEEGFANPELPEAELEYAQAFAERYPWVKDYTVFNEPFVTSLLCGHEGVWYPFCKGPWNLFPMLVNVGRAICMVSGMLIKTVPDVRLYHVETCEHHQAIDEESEDWVDHMNHRRFLMHDLILGRVNEEHPLYGYLRRYPGFPEEMYGWFCENATRMDVLGLDYYCHSEHQYHKSGSVVPSATPRGFQAVANDYIERYQVPVMLTETNLRGFVQDRVTWLKYMVEQCEHLVEQGVDFKGFCWFPFIDSTDWDTLLQKARGKVDPVGIYWLDRKRHMRNASMLSDYFGMLARGEATSQDIPAYILQPPLDRQLKGFLPQMSHYEWRDPQEAERKTA